MNQESRIRNQGNVKKRIHNSYFIIHDSGFTLIELLIVITIIGVLASLLMSNFIGVRQRARDGQRKSDLRQIQAALEIYRADIGTYPTTALPACPTSGSLIGTGTFASSTYMQKIPCEPLGTTAYNSGVYYYSSGGSTYTLGACLENANDPQGIATSPGGSGCTSNYYYVLTPP